MTVNIVLIGNNRLYSVLFGTLFVNGKPGACNFFELTFSYKHSVEQFVQKIFKAIFVVVLAVWKLRISISITMYK